MSEQAAADDAPKPPGKPRGRSLRWTQADIDRLADVGPEDMPEADAAFKRHAPKAFKNLLDAEGD